MSHPENDSDITERAQGYTLQDTSFMRQSRRSFLNAWENTQVVRAATNVFFRNTRWRHSRSQGETKYSASTQPILTEIEKCWGSMLILWSSCCFQWLHKWIRKCDDDSETSNWIAANTKECPKCHVTIEKDGGCNHMVCRNQSCKVSTETLLKLDSESLGSVYIVRHSSWCLWIPKNMSRLSRHNRERWQVHMVWSAPLIMYMIYTAEVVERWAISLQSVGCWLGNTYRMG